MSEVTGNTSAKNGVTVIEPSRGWVSLKLRDIWMYRELVYFLAWRDIKVRYKQAALGGAWAILQPVFMMVVFSLFFGRLAKISSDGFPYPIFSYSALLPWTYFSLTLAQSSQSLVSGSRMITRVYFPRLVMPVSTSLAGLVDFVLSFSVLIGLMLYFRIEPTVAMAMLPCFLVLAAMTALGASLWLSALNVHYRDVRFMVPFLTQLWLFATPVAYPSSLLGEPWRTIYGLNPMVGVVEGFRWALLGNTPPGPMLWASVLVAILFLISGAFYFRRMERTFADIV